MTTLELKALPECLAGSLPAAVRAFDLEREDCLDRLSPSPCGTPYERVIALLRSHGRPLGWTSVPVAPDGIVRLPTGLVAAARASLSEGPLAREPQASAARDCLLTVVVATCADTRAVAACVEAILASESPLEVVVVENRPAGSAVPAALQRRSGTDPRVRLIEEPRRGLASARNAGLHAAKGELVAFTDDDVLVDPGWIDALRATFAVRDVDCVTGLIAPLELECPEQVLLERLAGYGKGFAPRLYELCRPPADEPLFPYAAGHFASGANMAFRTEALRRLGGFDEALGTGTPARGCEDLDVCVRLLLAGGRLAYEPRATVWHRHPATPAGVRHRAFDYGTALGAMVTKFVAFGPDRSALIRKAPAAARYYLSASSRKNAGRGGGYPASLRLLELAGMLYGPVAYLISRTVRR
ncbi:MAG TPA: glycosyltransferase [Solirubrobacteraceae bacterium]|jgi:GT2 family glycosyltransferase